MAPGSATNKKNGKFGAKLKPVKAVANQSQTKFTTTTTTNDYDGSSDDSRGGFEPDGEGGSSDSGDGDSGVLDNDSYEGSSEDGDDDELPAVKAGDGMADMMARILHQKVDAKVAVLAKRKTPLMKEIETDRQDQVKLKKMRLDRKKDKMKQMVVPTSATNDFERQLKKLATRGVVALFNAIAKAKRDSQEEEGHDDGGKSEIPTGSKSAADDEVDGEEEDQEEEREEAVQDSRSGVARKSRARAADGANSSVKQHVKAKGKGWAALQDDYLVKPSGGPLSIKSWDKESDSE